MNNYNQFLMWSSINISTQKRCITKSKNKLCNVEKFNAKS